MNNQPTIFLYHQITKPEVDNQLLAVSPEYFDAHLTYLKSKYRVVPLATLLEEITREQLLPHTIAITFDDGYADNLYNALPILEKHQLHATFFITTGLIDSEQGFWGGVFEDVFLTGRELPATFFAPFWNGVLPTATPDERLAAHDTVRIHLKYHSYTDEVTAAMAQILEWAGLPTDHTAHHRMMRADEVRRLAASPFAAIGAHCESHMRLSLLTEEEQRNEIETSCRELEKIVGHPIAMLAYPFGGTDDYNDVTRAIIKEKSLYGIAGMCGDVSKATLPADIPRYLVRNWNQESFIKWLASGINGKLKYEQVELAQRLSRVKAGPVMLKSERPVRTKRLHSITYINTHSGTGGAAASTERLRASLEKRGYRTKVLTGPRIPATRKGYSLFPSLPLEGLRRYCERSGLLDYAYQGSHLLFQNPAFIEADLIHLQNLHGGYFNPWSLSGLSHIKPIVWTLRDMQALTGHCAHAFECEKWQWTQGCASCPDLTVYPAIRKDKTARLWADKKKIYEHSQLWIVVPSTWMLKKVEKSILRNRPVSLIANAADTEIFRPRDRLQSRLKFNLPPDALIIGGSADEGALENFWKGGKYALEAVKALTERFTSLIFLNIGGAEGTTASLPNIINISYKADPAQLAELYSCLDLFLYPTLADSFSLAACESLCCGTPVVGFATGGVTDVVRNGIDGILVPTGDVGALIEAATTILKDADRRNVMAHAARLGAEKRFNLDLMASRYEGVYAEALARFNPVFYRPFSPRDVPLSIQTPAFYKLERKKHRAMPNYKAQYVAWAAYTYTPAQIIIRVLDIPLAVFYRLASKIVSRINEIRNFVRRCRKK